ncbi:hypothetical protein L226DRAFT_42684 [Lentinus tigrinus ALCF2SS1-7]|uniref:uncharacterized protein n=1 Tax=Lentinus tigrinus ALCF2SS1-7 TaxID=1328758 RepID=UPI001165E1D6|nr:hypothetical protein L226DRAFT_42684 [Lentinus tigrinus ALCF2SS1-7]
MDFQRPFSLRLQHPLPGQAAITAVDAGGRRRRGHLGPYPAPCTPSPYSRGAPRPPANHLRVRAHHRAHQFLHRAPRNYRGAPRRGLPQPIHVRPCTRHCEPLENGVHHVLLSMAAIHSRAPRWHAGPCILVRCVLWTAPNHGDTDPGADSTVSRCVGLWRGTVLATVQVV